MHKTPDGKDTNAPSRSLPELKKALRYLKDDCDKPEPCLENCPYWFECNSVFYPRLHVPHAVIMDALAYIQQLEAERLELQNRIHEQRRQLRLLHAMYEWALSILRKAKQNDRAKLKRWLQDRGFDPKTYELPNEE